MTKRKEIWTVALAKHGGYIMRQNLEGLNYENETVFFSFDEAIAFTNRLDTLYGYRQDAA